jgi:hypothetical protein
MTGVEVRTVGAARWNSLLDDAPAATAFHRAEALDVCAEHTGGDCHRLVGFVGEEPVGVFPLFTVQKGPVTAAFSPPPALKIHYLGPAMLDRQDLSRRKRDDRNREFVDASLDWLDGRADPKYTTVRTAPGYGDVRPFVWQDFDATPRYTYVVDLDPGREELLSSFSSDARRNVTREYDTDYEILDGGRDAIRRIVSQARERHDEQGESFRVTPEFVVDLYDALPDGTIRPYACHTPAGFEGGVVNVEFRDRGTCWLGASKTDSSLPVNDLVEWAYCCDGMDRGVSRYDLAGANDARICSFKAKFAPDLAAYYRVETGTRGVRAASKLYAKLR